MYENGVQASVTVSTTAQDVCCDLLLPIIIIIIIIMWCCAQVDACGTHSLVCKQAPGRGERHHVLNDVVARAFASAGFPVSKEPAGLSRVDGKRPDGMTLIPWQAGKLVAWDVTVICTTGDSYVEALARESGAAAEIAVTCRG